jgi:hypothetical protein
VTLVTDEAPKSAYELAMERLRKKDAEAGVEQTALTDEQRAAIAEARKVAEARVAEREILHQSALRGVVDPASVEELDLQYRRDRDRIQADLERKIAEIRSGS